MISPRTVCIPSSFLIKRSEKIFRHLYRYPRKVEPDIKLNISNNYSINSDSASPPKFSIGDYQSHPMKS
ncbi:hypothetical protein FCG26_17625 [Klebsiella pneumoniae]|nr:hypothetical protein [Klebsiella pneumoniae]MBZ6609687.1 hypothetical protein [Klebsiella pneumoniae]MBZ7845185.1 hypothetical protein [Klebsiella pneumoniae]MCQ4017397.1 hypothetical protein [Klebsiella pneumoniae]PXH37738.1 hypothetical protein DMQ64_24065 [Klebsiella pneumoniae]